MQLSCAAEYVGGADIVLAHAWLYTPGATAAQDVFTTKDVETAVCELLNSRDHVVASIAFDRLCGNQDGGFHFSFSHPAEYRGLRVRVVITTAQGHGYRAEAVVQQTAAPPQRLAGQPDGA